MSVSSSKDFYITVIASVSATDDATNLDERHSTTFFVGEKGDEVADYSLNFKKGTTALRSVSVNFYGNNLRALDATTEDALAMSVSYSKYFDITGIASVTATDDATNLEERQSKTFFV